MVSLFRLWALETKTIPTVAMLSYKPMTYRMVW